MPATVTVIDSLNSVLSNPVGTIIEVVNLVVVPSPIFVSSVVVFC